MPHHAVAVAPQNISPDHWCLAVAQVAKTMTRLANFRAVSLIAVGWGVYVWLTRGLSWLKVKDQLRWCRCHCTSLNTDSDGLPWPTPFHFSILCAVFAACCPPTEPHRGLRTDWPMPLSEPICLHPRPPFPSPPSLAFSVHAQPLSQIFENQRKVMDQKDEELALKGRKFVKNACDAVLARYKGSGDQDKAIIEKDGKAVWGRQGTGQTVGCGGVKVVGGSPGLPLTTCHPLGGVSWTHPHIFGPPLPPLKGGCSCTAPHCAQE